MKKVPKDEAERDWRIKFDVVCVDHAVEPPKNGFGGAPVEVDCKSARPVTSTDLLAARTDQNVTICSAAINAVVAWRFTVIMLLGHQVPDCRAGLMFAEHEANFMYGHAMERHEDSGPVGRCVSGFISVGAGTAGTIRIQETGSWCTGKTGSRSPHLANASGSASAGGAHCPTKNDLLQCAPFMTRQGLA